MVRQRSRGRRVQLEMGASPEADHEPASSTQPITDTTVLMLSCVDIDADTQQPQQDQPPPCRQGLNVPSHASTAPLFCMAACSDAPLTPRAPDRQHPEAIESTDARQAHKLKRSCRTDGHWSRPWRAPCPCCAESACLALVCFSCCSQPWADQPDLNGHPPSGH